MLPSQSNGCSTKKKAYQIQLKQGACPEHKIPVVAYLALELPGHSPLLGPKWPTELPTPHSCPPGQLETGMKQSKQKSVSLVA